MKTQGEDGGWRKKERGGKREIGEEEERERADWEKKQYMEWVWNGKITASPIRENFFLFCFVSLVMDSQSHLLLLSVWWITPLHSFSSAFVVVKLQPMYLLQYLALWILHACLPTRVLWTGIEKWLFEKSLWWWAQFVFNAKKFVWTLWNMGLCRCWGLSWEGRCLPAPLFQHVWMSLLTLPRNDLTLFTVCTALLVSSVCSEGLRSKCEVLLLTLMPPNPKVGGTTFVYSLFQKVTCQDELTTLVQKVDHPRGATSVLPPSVLSSFFNSFSNTHLLMLCKIVVFPMLFHWTRGEMCWRVSWNMRLVKCAARNMHVMYATRCCRSVSLRSPVSQVQVKDKLPCRNVRMHRPAERDI